MQCERMQPLLGALQDGELGPAMAFRVRRHLRGCPYCTAEVAALLQGDARLRAAIPFGAENQASPPALRRRVLESAVAVALSALVLFGAMFLLRRSAVKRESTPTTMAQVSIPRPGRGAKPLRAAPIASSVIVSVRPTVAPVAPADFVSATLRRKPRKGRNRPRQAKRLSPPRVRRSSQLASVVKPSRTPLVTPVKPEAPPISPKEPEILIIASRTLTREEIVQQQRNTEGFIYIESLAIPPTRPTDLSP